jgi:hypothetical protein
MDVDPAPDVSRLDRGTDDHPADLVPGPGSGIEITVLSRSTQPFRAGALATIE